MVKESKAKYIGQFRPISLLNIDGKVFFGILAGRVIGFVQKKRYIYGHQQKKITTGFLNVILQILLLFLILGMWVLHKGIG